MENKQRQDNPTTTIHKPELTPAELREVIKVSLWAGQLLLQHGADSARVQDTIHHISTGLGCDWMDVVINVDSIIATTIYHGDFRTKVRYVPQRAVDMNLIAEINRLSYKIEAGELDYAGLYAALEELDRKPRVYNLWVTALMVGLACGAFSQLFGGDLAIFGITWFSSSVAMLVSQELQAQYFNRFIITIITAGVAAGIAGFLSYLVTGSISDIALAAAVILLVPGVPLINAAEDLFNSHINTGIVRGVTGFLIAFCIALGLLVVTWLIGLVGL